MEYGLIRMANGENRRVSRLVLGTANFGTSTARDDAFRMMDAFWEAGGNAFDTARVYADWVPGGHGASEKTLGAWVRARGLAGRAFVITKGAHPPLSDMTQSRLARADILSDVRDSLDALGLDQIDLYYLHRDDINRGVDDIMGSLNELVAAGQVKSLGGSNWRAGRLAEANAYAVSKGFAPFSASELRWSLVHHPEGEGDQTLVDMDDNEHAKYEKMNLAVMAYSSQGLGLFSRGYKPDLSDAEPKQRGYVCEENVRRYQALLDKCAKENVSPSRVVIRHITDDPRLNAFAVVGCSRLAQLNASLEAMA